MLQAADTGTTDGEAAAKVVGSNDSSAQLPAGYKGYQTLSAGLNDTQQPQLSSSYAPYRNLVPGYPRTRVPQSNAPCAAAPNPYIDHGATIGPLCCYMPMSMEAPLSKQCSNQNLDNGMETYLVEGGELNGMQFVGSSDNPCSQNGETPSNDNQQFNQMMACQYFIKQPCMQPSFSTGCCVNGTQSILSCQPSIFNQQLRSIHTPVANSYTSNLPNIEQCCTYNIPSAPMYNRLSPNAFDIKQENPVANNANDFVLENLHLSSHDLAPCPFSSSKTGVSSDVNSTENRTQISTQDQLKKDDSPSTVDAPNTNVEEKADDIAPTSTPESNMVNNTSVTVYNTASTPLIESDVVDVPLMKAETVAPPSTVEVGVSTMKEAFVSEEQPCLHSQSTNSNPTGDNNSRDTSLLNKIFERMSVKTQFEGGYIDYEVNLSAVEKERKVITDVNGNPASEEIIIKKSKIGQTTNGDQYHVEKRTTIRTPRVAVPNNTTYEEDEEDDVDYSESCAGGACKRTASHHSQIESKDNGEEEKNTSPVNRKEDETTEKEESITTAPVTKVISEPLTKPVEQPSAAAIETSKVVSQSCLKFDNVELKQRGGSQTQSTSRDLVDVAVNTDPTRKIPLYANLSAQTSLDELLPLGKPCRERQNPLQQFIAPPPTSASAITKREWGTQCDFRSPQTIQQSYRRQNEDAGENGQVTSVNRKSARVRRQYGSSGRQVVSTSKNVTRRQVKGRQITSRAVNLGPMTLNDSHCCCLQIDKDGCLVNVNVADTRTEANLSFGRERIQFAPECDDLHKVNRLHSVGGIGENEMKQFARPVSRSLPNSVIERKKIPRPVSKSLPFSGERFDGMSSDISFPSLRAAVEKPISTIPELPPSSLPTRPSAVPGGEYIEEDVDFGFAFGTIPAADAGRQPGVHEPGFPFGSFSSSVERVEGENNSTNISKLVDKGLANSEYRNEEIESGLSFTTISATDGGIQSASGFSFKSLMSTGRDSKIGPTN